MFYSLPNVRSEQDYIPFNKSLKLRIVIKTNASGIFLYFTPILVAKMLGTRSKKEERLSSYHGWTYKNEFHRANLKRNAKLRIT